MKTLLLALLLLTGCSVPTYRNTYDTTDAPDPREDAWRSCLLDRPVCVEAVYCDADALENDPRCAQSIEGTCVVQDVPQGEQCLDTTRSSGVGHCDGKGLCK